jgi:group I intron endonuclease
MGEIIGGIYCIINTESGKPYVGSGVSFNRRKTTHFSKLKLNAHGNPHLQNSFNYYGKDKFIFEIIENIERTEEMTTENFKNILLERENYWIDFLKSNNRDYGYNIRKEASSNLGMKLTEEQIQKVSGKNNHNFGKPMLEETKQKLREINYGENSPHYGEKQSEETKKRRSNTMMGHKTSEETKQKISNSQKGEKGHNYGKHLPEETKQKQSNSLMGHKISEETRLKISRANAIPLEIILQIKELLDKNVNKKDIIKIVKVSKSTINRVASGYYKGIWGI